MTDDKTLLGLNKLGFSLLDSRLAGDKVVNSRRYLSFFQILFLFSSHQHLLYSIECILIAFIPTNSHSLPPTSFMYKPSTRPELSCAATTEDGQMVVGSKTGEIRMFSQKSMNQDKKDLEQAPRAKTTLPGFGGNQMLIV